ncbi:MAG TPA: c-type cytochrome, partial [Polyangiaceae bacterium]
MSPHARFRLISIGSIVFALACSKGENPSGAPPAAVAPPVPAAEPAATAASSARYDAKVMFKARCVVCHGEKGHGDGPGAAALNPKPRDYTDPAWQGSVTDEQ